MKKSSSAHLCKAISILSQSWFLPVTISVAVATTSLVGLASHNVWIDIVEATSSNTLALVVLKTKSHHSILKLAIKAHLGNNTLIFSSSLKSLFTLYKASFNTSLSLYLTSLVIRYQPFNFLSSSISSSSFLYQVKSVIHSQLSLILLVLLISSLKLALALLSSSWIYNQSLKS